MRKRLLVTGLGVIVVAIALAGLLGVLNQLSNTKPTDTSGSAITGSHNPGTNADKTSGLNPGANPNVKLPSTTNLPNPAGAAGSGNIPGLPAGGQIPKVGDPVLAAETLATTIDPQGSLPPHIPLFDVSGASNIGLLRSMATSTYNNGAWQIDPKAQSTPYLGERLNPPVINFNHLTTSTVKVTPLEKFSSGALPVPVSLYPASVSSSKPLTYYPAEQAFVSQQGLPDSYSFQSINYSFDKTILDKATVDPEAKYLQLPPQTTERTKQLARQITAGIPGPYQKAEAIKNYLKSNYAYDFDYKPAPNGVDPNDWFLFDEKRGVCSNFNSAFVTLARSAGIPSRLVSGFAIDATPAEQVVYADQAHAWSEVKFKDLGWIPFDATGASTGPIPTRTEITGINPEVRKGHTCTVQGTVLTENGKPVDGVPVEIFINTQKSTEGGTRIGQGMVNNGSFSIEGTIPEQTNVGNYQLLAHSLGGVRYQHSWSDPQIKVITDTKISLNAPQKVKIMDPVTIQGKLLEESNQVIPGQKVNLTIGNQPAVQLTTDKDGQFRLTRTFDQSGDFPVQAEYSNTDFYLSSRQATHIQALVPTVLKIQVPAKASLKDQAAIQGSLNETASGKPVAGQTIQVLINNKPAKTPIITDKNGLFKVENAFDKAGIYQIQANFNSVPFYWESQDKAVTEIQPVVSASTWILPVAVTALVILSAGSYIWLRRRQAASRSDSPSDEPADAGPVPVLPPAEDNHNYGITLSIEFPGIEPALPDVWGLGEDLEVICRLINSEGVPLAAKPLDFLIGKSKTSVNTDADGIGNLRCTFSKKGTFSLMARYNGEPGIEKTSASRVIRIVDYREEIVELFNSLLTWLRELGLNLSQEATPREIKRAVLRAGRPIPEGALNQAITGFEEADYSTHTIIRKNYQAMYLAQKEIRKSEQTPAVVG